MAGGLPAIKPSRFVRLMIKDGWYHIRNDTHGWAMGKEFNGQTRVITIPRGKKNLPKGTLHAILGPMQTGLGRAGFLALVKEHGV